MDINTRRDFHAVISGTRTLDYVFQLHESLVEAQAGKKLLYLDTCYWLHLRDVRMGRSRDPKYVALLEILTRLKCEGKIICVASASLLAEFDQQTDDLTRRATALLMEDFSENMCLVAPHVAMRNEFKAHLLRYLLGEHAPDLTARFFTKPIWVYGLILPNFEVSDDAERVVMQKTAIDAMWSQGITSFLQERLSLDAKIQAKEMAEALKVSGEEWRSQRLDFDEIRIRIQSILSEPNLRDLRTIGEELQDEYPHLADKLRIPDESKSEKSIKLMPHIQVLASALAALIHNRVEAIVANDVIDMEHASVALPLCDALFLDRRAAALLNAGPNSIAKAHGKGVFGTIDEAISYLPGLQL